MKTPNILLTIADDQRGSALGCEGIEPVQTPHLDRLAARGTRYAQAQHFGSCHGAICAPSRAMLHTGHPYFSLPDTMMGPRGPAEKNTPPLPAMLGEKLRTAGYDTFATGKWHNGVDSLHASFSHGENIFFGGMADHFFTPVSAFDPEGKYPLAAENIADGFSTEVFARSAIDFLRSRKTDDAPFFCYCAFTAPHDPRTPPDHWRQQYNPADLTLPPNIPTTRNVFPTVDIGSSDERDELLLGTPRDSMEIRRSLAEYYGMISHMDEWIGLIHNALRETDQERNTIVIHTADHGLALGQHGLLGKQNLFQHSLRVPLLLAGPGITEGEISNTLCYQHDLHPTLLAAAGLPDKGGFQNLTSTNRTHLGAAFRDTLRSIRNQRFKLITYRIGDDHRSELYDLENDPWETNNLAEKKEYAATKKELITALQDWQVRNGDTQSL